METVVEQVDTSTNQFLDLTGRLQQFVTDRGDGLCSIFAPHATAGLAIFELNAGSEDDLAVVLGRLLPKDDRWVHRHGSPGHGADHVLPALIAPSITIPVFDGRPALGTWQYLVLVDTNVDNTKRSVRFSFLQG